MIVYGSATQLKMENVKLKIVVCASHMNKIVGAIHESPGLARDAPLQDRRRRRHNHFQLSIFNSQLRSIAAALNDHLYLAKDMRI